MRLRGLGLALGLASVLSFAAPPAWAQKEADPRLERATLLVAHAEYEVAEKALAELAKGPTRGAALLLQAQVELGTGRYGKAAETAKAAGAGGKDAKIAAAPVRAEALARLGKLDEAMSVLRDVENEPEARRARLLLGELLLRVGKRSDAAGPLRTLIDDYNSDAITETDAEGLTLVGRAAHLLRSPRDANDAYNKAERAGAKKSVEALLYRAELFLEKYDPGNAGKVVKEALVLAPKSPEAHVMMARVRLESSMDFEAAESEVREALAVNPNLASAYAVKAGLALRDLDTEAADAAIARGLQINPKDLELLSVKAAIRFLADDKPGFDAAKAEVFKQNPEYSAFFQTVGEFAEWEHRYDEIVKMMREASEVDRQDAKALAILGLNLIRSGEETEALVVLNKAWKRDKFNVRVYNTLNLYEKDIATQYVTVDGTPFRIRYHKEEKAVLERYVPRMLEEAYASMVKRYGFRPSEPVTIELYADPQHFSVRTSGLPNVGIQGVCFGKTLAAMSPAAGEFNWGNVLWHELGHVFALQMSKSHVPRWFTEGLSEYETIVRRPEWKREEDPSLYAALSAHRLPPMAGMNRAFTHVKSIEEVTTAYYAASQMVVFMAEELGFDKVVSALPRWGAGQRTPEVIRGAFGMEVEELDQRFRAWAEKRLTRYGKQFVPDLHAPPLEDARKAALATPTDAKKQVELALALFEDGQEKEGLAVLDEVLRGSPKEPTALYLKVRVALSKKDLPGASAALDAMIAAGADGYAVRMKAADVAEGQKDSAKMKAHLEAAHRFDPTMAEPIQALYDLAHHTNDEAGEIAALEKLALIDQHGRQVYDLLLQKLVAKGRFAEAVKVGEAALFIDVMNPEVHRLYARALARTGRFLSAIYELNSAILAGAKPADQVLIYGELAQAYEKLGRPESAKKAAEYAAEAKTRGGPSGPPGAAPGPRPSAPPDEPPPDEARILRPTRTTMTAHP